MNAAIIIGVQTYLTLPELPACKNDAEAIHEIIKRSEKYSQILFLNDETDSVRTKNLLSEFIAQLKQHTVDEIFFYYSGHGEFYDDQFYYLLSDYDAKKRNQTALQNSEVDQLFRTLSPGLTVKVIDSCQSGTNYIKASDTLDAYFRKSAQDRFKNCYFIYSSLNTQSSYASHDISFFTSSLISAIKSHQGDDVRYKYVIDVIADDFINNSGQKPFFVIQASLTEKFLSFNKRLRDYFTGSSDSENVASKTIENKPTLVERIRLDSKNYTDKAGALKVFEAVRSLIKEFALKPEFNEFYKISSQFLQAISNTPGKWPVGNWLRDHPGEYFVTPIYEDGFDEEAGDYTYLKDIHFNFETPFKEITLDIIGIYPNVPSFNCDILLFVSKRSVRFFYCINRYKDLDFDEMSLVTGKSEWITAEEIITNTNGINKKITEIKSKVEDLIEADLLARFSPGAEETNTSEAV
jgi:hypothetical protein